MFEIVSCTATSLAIANFLNILTAIVSTLWGLVQNAFWLVLLVLFFAAFAKLFIPGAYR